MDFEKVKEILRGRGLSDNPWSLLERAEAYWVFRDLPDEPHVILTFGNHSDGYFNVSQAIQFSNICNIFAGLLQENIKSFVDAVVSSSYAALPLGMEIARQLGSMFFFTEKVGDEQRWSGRFELFDDMRLLHVEDLITSFGTVEKVHNAVISANLKVQFVKENGKTLVLSVVHRPVVLAASSYEVLALIEKEVHEWKPEDCPLCKKGSVALRPKSNWEKFQKFTEM